MRWLSDRFKTLTEALTIKRVLAISAIAGVATSAAKFSEYLSEYSGAILLGVQGWTWGILAFLLTTLYYIIEYANRQRISFIPKIKVFFDPSRLGIVQTPLASIVTIDNEKRLIPAGDAVYLRISLDSESKLSAHSCEAFITKIQKKVGAEFQSIELNYAISLGRTDCHPKITRTIDFLYCKETENKLRLPVPEPLNLSKNISKPATYRFDIVVNADGISQSISIDVDWNGQWDKIDARQVNLDNAA